MVLPVHKEMPQRKVQQRQRLSGSGGSRQCKESLRCVAHVPALFKNLVPIGVQGLIRRGLPLDIVSVGVQFL